MSGAAENGTEFCGVDLAWMQAMWRDCADREAQLVIFQDMTRASPADILTALGEDPETVIAPMNHRGRWTPKEDEFLLRSAADGISDRAIADFLGCSEKNVQARFVNLRKKGVRVPARRRGKPGLPVTAEEKPADKPEEVREEVPEKIPREAPEKVPEEEPERAGGAAVSHTDECLTGILEEILALTRAEEELLSALVAVRARKAEIRDGLRGMMELLGGDEDG